MDIFPLKMLSEKPDENRATGTPARSSAIGGGEMKARAERGPGKSPGKSSGVFNVYNMSGAAILVNINAAQLFDYRTLYRITSLAIGIGGVMEVCNEDIAIFAFPKNNISEFMESIGFEIRILKTVVSPKEKGISKVNIRFLGY